jgi:hypothetical protein
MNINLGVRRIPAPEGQTATSENKNISIRKGLPVRIGDYRCGRCSGEDLLLR